MKKKVLNTIGAKVTVSMLAITVLVVVIALSSYLLSIRTEENTRVVAEADIPSAILSISMLDEIGDMNANVLEYVLGEAEEREEFEDNYLEFSLFFSDLKQASVIRKRRLDEINRLFSEYSQRARTEIFDRYNPESEGWARQRVLSLTEITGSRLEELLDELKDSEVADAGREESFDEVVNDDLPGVRYYLELLDEAGDMVSNLTKYVNGIEAAKNDFLRDSQTFEVFLAQLKPLEQRPAEIAALKEVQGLYLVLRDGGLEVFQRYNPRDKIEAIRSIDRLEHEVFSRLEFLLDDISSEASKVASDALNELNSLTENNIYVLSIMVGVVILFCLMVVYYAYRSVVLPITDLINSMQSLSEGNTGQVILYQDREDEIGTMAASIEVFKNNLLARSDAEQALLEAKERAESASRAKASFLATMSHEIRTPMNGVIGMIDLMMESPMTQDQRSVMKTVRDSSFSLLNIINDILDFSKIEAGKLELENVCFDLNAVVESVVDTMQISARDQDVCLDLHSDLAIPLEMYGDPMRIRQVVFNIIGNAIKFSSQSGQDGHVWVRTRLLNESSSRVRVQLQIIDNGIGIRQEELDGLFLPFTQAESSTTRRFGGTGLGLAICHNLVTLMKGDIRVESQYGHGASFSIELELSASDNQQYLKYDGSGLIVLLDLHDNNLKELCMDYLQKMGVEVMQLGSDHGRIDLIRQYLNQQLHVVLYRDHHQPGALDDLFTQYPLFRQLQLTSDQRTSGSVINGYTYTLECHPLKPSALIHAMNILSGREEPEEVSVQEPEVLIMLPESVQQAQELGRLILVAEDNQVNQDVISRQLKSLGYLCVIASDGIEAEAMYDLYDYAMVLTDCHMPRRDGYELARVLKDIQAQRSEFVPVIAITANALLGEAEKCFEAGMDDYLAKPVEMDKLRKTLEQWADKAVFRRSVLPDNALAQTESTGTPVVTSTQEDSGIWHIDLSVLKNIYGGDIQGFADSLQDFRELVLPELANLYKEVTQDTGELKARLHQYKSPARSVGLSCIAECLERAEQMCLQHDVDEDQIRSVLFDLQEHLPEVDQLICNWLETYQR